MALNKSDLPQSVQDKLSAMLRKEIVELTLADRVMLQARRDYLTDAEQEKFSDILTDKAIEADGPKLQKQQRDQEKKLGVGEFRGASVPVEEPAPSEPAQEETPKAKAKK